MHYNIITFLNLNKNTEADKQNQNSYNNAVQNGGLKLPDPVIFITEGNKIIWKPLKRVILK
jgi:hypothetical protein